MFHSGTKYNTYGQLIFITDRSKMDARMLLLLCGLYGCSLYVHIISCLLPCILIRPVSLFDHLIWKERPGCFSLVCNLCAVLSYFVCSFPSFHCWNVVFDYNILWSSSLLFVTHCVLQVKVYFVVKLLLVQWFKHGNICIFANESVNLDSVSSRIQKRLLIISQFIMNILLHLK